MACSYFNGRHHQEEAKEESLQALGLLQPSSPGNPPASGGHRLPSELILQCRSWSDDFLAPRCSRPLIQFRAKFNDKECNPGKPEDEIKSKEQVFEALGAFFDSCCGCLNFFLILLFFQIAIKNLNEKKLC